MGRINCKLKVGAYMQNFGRKKAKVIIITAVILIVVVCVGFKLQSTLNYNIMSLSETLKGQLKTEMDFYSDEAFKSVEVIRPDWYSLSAKNWTFAVVFSDSPAKHYYRLEGKAAPYTFIEIDIEENVT